MSVSRRVVVTIAVLMVLAFASLGYQLWIVARMQRNNDELAKINFEVASALLRMEDLAFTIEELTEKYFVLSDAAQREDIGQALDWAVTDYRELFKAVEATPHPWEAPEEIALLSTAWIHYLSQLEPVRKMENPGSAWPPELELAIGNVNMRTTSSKEAVFKGIDTQVERNRTIGKQAQAVSILAGVVFLITGTTLAFLTLRSINTPLQHLIRGTRSISGGKFSHRLPEDGPLEFAELARDFNKMTEKLGELDQMKKDFVAHVSHELKAPLAAIRQTLAVTIEQIPGPINEQQRRLLLLSRNSAERLSAMVANLLDVSRLEAGTMDYEMSQQDLTALAQTVVEEFSLKAEDRRIKLTFTADSPVSVVCDRDRMMQVVGNLVDNALKFAPANSAIQVDLVCQPSNNGTAGSAVTLSVSDQGPGVPEAHKRAVFEKFHQVKGGGKRSVGQGVGLGLAICKTIVDAHRGRIWVEDNPGGGSVFRMEMRGAQKQESIKCG
jgi:signal transduction histidine kinase